MASCTTMYLPKHGDSRRDAANVPFRWDEYTLHNQFVILCIATEALHHIPAYAVYNLHH